MIKDHEAFMFGEDGPHQFLFEVNWQPDDKETNECKLIKVTFPAKASAGEQKVTYVKREHFHAFLFAISKEEDQAVMVPYKAETVRTIETTVGVKATKNIAKGEMINFPIKLNIPLGIQEKIGRIQAGQDAPGSPMATPIIT